MHMGDALVSPAVGGVMLAVAAGMVVYSAVKSKKTMDRKKIPMMGVMAFAIAGVALLLVTKKRRENA